MFKINQDIKVSDFSKETKEFLLDSGFSENDDISKMFSEFLSEKGIENKQKLANLYDLDKIINYSETFSYSVDSIINLKKQSRVSTFSTWFSPHRERSRSDGVIAAC